jgi:hypothetical protein
MSACERSRARACRCGQRTLTGYHSLPSARGTSGACGAHTHAHTHAPVVAERNGHKRCAFERARARARSGAHARMHRCVAFSPVDKVRIALYDMFVGAPEQFMSSTPFFSRCDVALHAGALNRKRLGLDGCVLGGFRVGAAPGFRVLTRRSRQVLLSASADSTIKLWSLDDYSCVRRCAAAPARRSPAHASENMWHRSP